MDDPKAKALLQRHEQMRSERYPYESNWQDVVLLVRPGTSDFHRTFSPSQTRTEHIYDSTAPQALEELANGLHSHLTSASERWFACETEDMSSLDDNAEALLWLEDVSDILYDEYSNPKVNLNASLNENYMDIGAFGWSVINQEWNPTIQHLNFRAFPTADCWIEEDAYNRVNRVHREVQMVKRQLIEMFGEDALPKKVREDESATKKWVVIHAVYPREKTEPGNYTPGNMRFASCWTLKEPAVTLKESGYNSFPYHVPRWTQLASELYGRGPGVKALPDIRMLNRMEYTIIRAAQKIVDPPLQATSDGFLGQIKTTPGSVIMREPGVEPLEALETKANIPIGLEMSDQRRESIRQCFYANFLRLREKNAEQTAYEIQEMVDEQLRMMSPMFGRLESELLGPMVHRSYELLNEHGRIPPAPEILQGRRLKVNYISPAARAQRSRKAIGIRRFFETIVPFAQVKPDVMDAFDADGAVQELAVTMGVSQKAVHSPEKMAGIRAKREQDQQIAQLTEAAEPVSKAVLNIAQAQQAGKAA